MISNCFSAFFSIVFSLGFSLGPEGSGTRPLLFHFGTSWKKLGQVPNPFRIILIPFILKGTKLVPKGLEPDPCFSTLVHVGKSGVKFQTPLESFCSLSLSARLGSARLGSARLSSRLGSARLLSRLGSARLGSARLGYRLGSARLGSARLSPG